MPEISKELIEAINKAYRTLEDLGSPEAIADHLGQMGIKGDSRPIGCPLTNYVKTVVDLGGWHLGTFVNMWGVTWGVFENADDGTYATYHEAIADAPNLQNFIYRHDRQNAWNLQP